MQGPRDPFGNPLTDADGYPVWVYEYANPWLDTDWMLNNGIDDDGDRLIDSDDTGCDVWYNKNSDDPNKDPEWVCAGASNDDTEATNHVGWYFDLAS